MPTNTQRYECSTCEHIVNSEDEMGSDYCSDGNGGEAWSNWICPNCGHWHGSFAGWLDQTRS
jgi:rubredoxin